MTDRRRDRQDAEHAWRTTERQAARGGVLLVGNHLDLPEGVAATLLLPPPPPPLPVVGRRSCRTAARQHCAGVCAGPARARAGTIAQLPAPHPTVASVCRARGSGTAIPTRPSRRAGARSASSCRRSATWPLLHLIMDEMSMYRALQDDKKSLDTPAPARGKCIGDDTAQNAGLSSQLKSFIITPLSSLRCWTRCRQLFWR